MGIARAPRRSSRVRVIPIPSMMMVRPTMLNLGVTQLKELGFNKPNTHPIVTHNGNAVDRASPASSTHSRILLLSLPAFALYPFDEMPHRSGPTLAPQILGNLDAEGFNGDGG